MALLGCTSATSVAYLARLDREMIRDGLAGCNAAPLTGFIEWDLFFEGGIKLDAKMYGNFEEMSPSITL